MIDNNFFGYIISGLEVVVDSILNALPHHTDIGLDAMVIDLMATTPVLLFLIVNQFISLAIPITVWTTILVMEAARAVIAAWMWIKNAIPFLG